MIYGMEYLLAQEWLVSKQWASAAAVRSGIVPLLFLLYAARSNFVPSAGRLFFILELETFVDF